MKTVIFHSADYDGIFCREIARKFLGPQNPNEETDVQYIGWNFGDPTIPFPSEGQVIVMDLPLDKEFTGYPAPGLDERIIWIDHHKSAIESHPKDIPGYRIDGVAACRLAWHWFSLGMHEGNPKQYPLADKQGFLDRLVREPLAVRLAGEYDVWTRGSDGNLLPDLWEFQCGLRAHEGMGKLDLQDLLPSNPPDALSYVDTLIEHGKLASAYGSYLNAEMMREAGFVLQWEGLRFLAVNNEGRGSQRFESRDKRETGHDALLSFGFTGRGWVVSMYHAKHRTDLDLSEIAVKHGGGGHRGACGFTCKTLPFSL